MSKNRLFFMLRKDVCTYLSILMLCVLAAVYIKNQNSINKLNFEKKVNTLYKEINEIRNIVDRQAIEAIYYDFSFKDDSVPLKNYITTNYFEVPEEVAYITAIITTKLCKKYNVDLCLIVGLMEVESSFNPFAISKHKARGLLQVRYSVWKDVLRIVNRSDLHDIETGIECGIRILLIYMGKNNNDLTKALQKYNGSDNKRFSTKVYSSREKFNTFLNNYYKS